VKNIEVLGIGCPSCKKTEKLIRKTLDFYKMKEGEDFVLNQITDPSEIASKGILATPGVCVDGKVVSTGKIPKVPEIEKWFEI